MKLYLASLGAGLLVGIVYSLLNVRSPAPPVVALLGLLGILIGEQVVPVARQLMAGQSLAAAVGLARCSDHLLGQLPGAQATAGDAARHAANHMAPDDAPDDAARDRPRDTAAGPDRPDPDRQPS